MGDIKGADIKDEIKGNEDGRVIILVERTGVSGNLDATLSCEAPEAR
jgi:hypothetical protein